MTSNTCLGKCQLYVQREMASRAAGVRRAEEIQLGQWQHRAWVHKLKDNAFYALNEML